MSSIRDDAAMETDPTQIRRMLAALVPGVYEVRIPEARRPRFYGSQVMYLQLPDDLDAGVSQIASLRGEDAAAVYMVGNPVNPALLGRGRAGFHKAKSTAADTDVTRRRLLYVDIDPVRPSAINASADEITAGIERTAAAVEWLGDEMGFPEPLFHGTSGSGGMILYRVDMPNDEDSDAQVQACLSALSDALSDDVVEVDTGVYNAARIFRVPGTINAKSNTPQPDRPWTVVTGTWAESEVSHG